MHVVLIVAIGLLAASGTLVTVAHLIGRSGVARRWARKSAERDYARRAARSGIWPTDREQPEDRET